MLKDTTRLDRVITCPRCGMAVWEPTLETAGCTTCRILDGRSALPLEGDEKARTH